VRTQLVLLAALAIPSAAAAAPTLVVNTASPVTAPGVTLNGIDQSTTFTMSYTVTNTGSGNGAGWNVQVSSTALTASGKTLPAMTVTTVARGNCSGTGCANPTNSITWPVTLSTTAAKIYNAAVNTGTGAVTLTPTYKVSYPANALPGTYTATVTVAVTAGP
jgi:hypothetical protein